MSNTKVVSYRFPKPIYDAIMQVSKDMDVNAVRVVEIAVLEFIYKRDQKISLELTKKYNQFLEKLGKKL